MPLKPKRPLTVRGRTSARGHPSGAQRLWREIRGLIEKSRERAAAAVNTELVLLYWQIGNRIRRDILRERRAGYGQRILSTLSKKLSWSHFVEILALADGLQRDFYAEMSRIERWSVRTLRHKIAGLLFERSALSQKPAKLARKELSALRESDQLTPDLVFRDPYFLDFLGLKDFYSERDLESALLRLKESGVRVAQYLTSLPPRRTLEKKLHQAIRAARERLESGRSGPRNRGQRKALPPAAIPGPDEN